MKCSWTSPRRIGIRSVTFVLVLLLDVLIGDFSVWAQPGIVAGALKAVRPKNAFNAGSRYDRSPVLPAFGERGIAEAEPSAKRYAFSDPNAVYPVASQNVSWISREGSTVLAKIFYPATRPVAGAKFSAVVYSHGLGASAENFSYLGNFWAGRGVVTICLRHPESDESIWRGKIRAMSELKEAYRKYWNARDRARALRSGIDYLYACHNEHYPWGEDVDLNSIGVAGNDLGALGALLLAGQLPPDNGAFLKDPRVAAVLALSPTVFCDSLQGPEVYGRIHSPLMIVSGTQDDGIVGTTKASERRIPYDSVNGIDRYLVILQGGDHRVYGGHRMGTKQANDVPYQETIARETADFWGAYLLKDVSVLSQMGAYGKTTPLSNAHIEWALGGGAL